MKALGEQLLSSRNKTQDWRLIEIDITHFPTTITVFQYGVN